MTMEALMIILGVILAYFVFVALAVVLARMIFPRIEINEDELLGIDNLKMKRRNNKNKSGNSLQKKYSLHHGKISTGYTMP